MATTIGNAAEPALRSLQPGDKKSRSVGATARDLASDERAFAVALEGGSARAEKVPHEPGAMPAGDAAPVEPPALTRSNGARMDAPTARSADILSAKDEAAVPTAQPERSDPINPVLSSMRAREPVSNTNEEPPALRPQTPRQPAVGLAKDASASRLEAAYLPSTTGSEPGRQPAEAKSTDHKTDPTQYPALALGDAILRGLQGKPEPEAAPPVSSATTNTELSQIAEKVASRILVAGRSTGAPEVRITLNESFLNGVEVRIRRDQGQVIVEFTPSSTRSQSLLHERGDDLQTALKERLGDDVRVEIRAQDAGRQNRDGRSRQRRWVRDETDNEE